MIVKSWQRWFNIT